MHTVLKMFPKRLVLVSTIFFTEKDIEMERKSLVLASHLNICLCHLKLGEYFQAKSSGTSALAIDPNNEKALYRRGLALLHLTEPQSAKEDFTKCLEIDPNNTAARTQLMKCATILKDQLQKEKKIYANMFDKFAKTDIQVKTN